MTALQENTIIDDHQAHMPSVTTGPNTRPCAAEVERVAFGLSEVCADPQAQINMARSEALLDTWIAQERCIYGVTTGYGPLATTHIDPRRSDDLQRNLVYHLATGVGRPLPWAQARAVVFCRLQALSQGLSAVSPRIPQRLAASLNAGLAPVIPQKGTVGASGDLTPLAHMALAFMGEGAWMDARGPVSNAAAFTRMNHAPLALGPKEGLALVNGTSAMTGIAALNGAAMRRLLKLSCTLSVINAEVFCGHAAAWHPLAGAARGQPGQQTIHDVLWALIHGSKRLQPFSPQPQKLSGAGDVRQGQALPQDPYSIRCAPQLLGACLDMLDMHDGITEREVSAVTDNPLVFPDEDTLIHAGNFFGQHVAFASDALNNAVIMTAVLLERQIARVTDAGQNAGLPAFLQGNETGLHSGFMGAQVTASALIAEMRTKANPASIQSIPTNSNNQDVVTMGTIAARRTAETLRDAGRVLAINALCMAQAIDLRLAQDRAKPFTDTAMALHAFVRIHSPFLTDDRPLSDEIENLTTALSKPMAVETIFADSSFVKDVLTQF